MIFGEYSGRISARSAQILNQRVLLDGRDLPGGIDELTQAPVLSTINWSIAATERRYFPHGNMSVFLFNRQLRARDEWSVPGQIPIGAATGFTLDIKAHLPGLPLSRYPWGVLACAFEARTDAPVEIWGLDHLGEEVPGSRVALAAGGPAAVFGPGVFALQAAGEMSIDRLSVFTLRDKDVARHEFALRAEVGPAYTPDPPAGGWRYEDQSYLGETALSPARALAYRLLADELARASAGGPQPVHPPVTAYLDASVHRRRPEEIWCRLKPMELVRLMADNIEKVVQQPYWTHRKMLGGSDYVEVPVGQLMQVLAMTGPVEATCLGQAVTLPIPSSPPIFEANAEIARFMLERGVAPFPVHVISADFFDAVSGQVAKEFAITGLDLPIQGGLVRLARQGQPGTAPSVLDGPASAPVELVVGKGASGSTFFLAKGEHPDDVIKTPEGAEAGLPKAFLALEPEPGPANPLGETRLDLGSFDLPPDAPAMRQLGAFPRDRFGRWALGEAVPVVLDPWPVGKPEMISARVSYPPDGSVVAQLRLSWNGRFRTLKEIRVASNILELPPLTAAEAKAEDREQQPFPMPMSGYGAFEVDPQGRPSFPHGNPLGLTVNLLSSAVPEIRTYDVFVPLGQAVDIFGKLTSPDNHLVMQFQADAQEAISGERWSQPPLPLVHCTLDDPRPPTLAPEPWRLTWSSLPNAVTGESRAMLRLPRPAGGPPPAGFLVWRAQETAVADLVLRFLVSEGRLEPGTEAAVLRKLRSETGLRARLGLLQPLMETALRRAEFVAAFIDLFGANDVQLVPPGADAVEVVLPASQSGFEFFLFTAMSKARVWSAKDPKSLMRIVAVPERQPRLTPDLRIFTSDDTKLLELTGHCLAMVSYPTAFAAESVRFYWDATPGRIDSNELLFRIEPVQELTRGGVEATYLSGLSGLLGDGDALEHRRFFLLKRPNDAAVQHFAVDLRSPGTQPLEEVPTRRSTIQSHHFG